MKSVKFQKTDRTYIQLKSRYADGVHLPVCIIDIVGIYLWQPSVI